MEEILALREAAQVIFEKRQYFMGEPKEKSRSNSAHAA